MNKFILALFLTATVLGLLSFNSLQKNKPKEFGEKKIKNTLFKEIEAYPLDSMELKITSSEEVSEIEYVDNAPQQEDSPLDILQGSTTCFGFQEPNACGGTNGQCTNNNTCSCNSGFGGEQCSIICVTQNFVSVQFSSGGSEIVIELSHYVNSTGIAFCSAGTSGFQQIFKNSTNYGTGATCTFDSLKTIRVTLGTSPLIKHGDLLQFNSGKISSVGSCGSSLSSPFTVAAPSILVAIKAVLLGTEGLPNCNTSSLVLDSSASIGAGELSYEWKLVNSAQYIFNQRINDILTSLNKNAQRVTLANDLFAINSNAGYAIQLTVIDYFGRTSTITHVVKKYLAIDVPSIVVNKFHGDLQSIDQITNLAVAAQTPTCGSNSTIIRSLGYLWTCTSHPNLQLSGTTSSIVSVPAYGLSAGQVYTFEVLATLMENGFGIQNATTTYTFTGATPGVTAQLAGAPSVNLFTTGMLILDGSSSRDYNVSTGLNPAATYDWTCCSLNTVNGACNATTCEEKFRNLRRTTTSSYTKTGLSLGTYLFTLKYSHLARSSTTQKLITIIEPQQPRLQYVLTRQTCNRYVVDLTTQNMGTSVLFSTTVTEGSVGIISNVQIGSGGLLILDTTNTNVRTILKVTATSSGPNVAIEEIVISPPGKPFGGSIVIIDENGNDVTGGTQLEGAKTYTLLVSGWKASSGASVFNRALITFNDNTTGSTSSALSFSLNSISRNFIAPLSSSKNLSAIASINLYTSDACSNIVQNINFGVKQYILVGGVTYEDLAQQQLDSELDNAISGGSLDEISNTASTILGTLEQNNGGGGNSAVRITIKERVVKALRDSLVKSGVVTSVTKISTLNTLSSSISVSGEVTTGVRTNSLDAMRVLFVNQTGSTGIVQTDANKAITLVATLVGSSKIDFQNTQELSQGIMREALLLTGSNQKYESTNAKLSVAAWKYPSASIPAGTLVPFAGDAFSFQASNLPGTNTANLVNLYFIKSDQTQYVFTNTTFLQTQIYGATFSTVGGQSITVTNANPPIVLTFRTDSLVGGDLNECRFLDEQTNIWVTTDVNTTSNSVNVSCSTPHLTQFSVFKYTPNVPSGGTDLTWLWVLLAIFLVLTLAACLVLIVVVVGYLVWRYVGRDGGSDNLRKLNFFKDEHETV